MVLALVESYLMISIGRAVHGVRRIALDQRLAVSTIRYTVSVGAKLIVLQLLVSVGNRLHPAWTATLQRCDRSSLCILVGCSIVMLGAGEDPPGDDATHRQRLQHGQRVGARRRRRGRRRRRAARSGWAWPAPARCSAMRCGSRARRWTPPTPRPREASGGTAPQRSRLGRAAAMTGYTARNLATAPLADIGRRLSGQGSRHGSPTWRMSADLANRTRLLRDDNSKPAPTPPPGGGNTIS